MAYQETLRRDSPAPISGISTMTKNVKINGLQLSEGDPFAIMIHYILNDPKQWKDPHRFIPDRFDLNSNWSKRPDGGKRSPFAFTPFLGGIRVCMGKSFADMALRTTIPLWFHFFDFELVEDTHKTKRPVVLIGPAEPIKIPMKLKTRQPVAEILKEL